jgi:hypothetical protein
MDKSTDPDRKITAANAFPSSRRSPEALKLRQSGTFQSLRAKALPEISNAKLQAPIQRGNHPTLSTRSGRMRRSIRKALHHDNQSRKAAGSPPTGHKNPA